MHGNDSRKRRDCFAQWPLMNEQMTIRHTLITTVLLLLLAVPTAAPAQETRYRVEVIVLTHIGHIETPREVAMLRDYGDALDFLAPKEAAENGGDESIEPKPGVGEDASSADDAAADEPADQAEETEPPPVVHIEELSDVMRDAWRRLRLSGPFRPLLSLAWEQASTPPFPQLRVHDENVVMTQDPWAAIRVRLEAGEPVDAWLEAGLVPPIPPRPPVEEDSTTYEDVAENPESALLERLPPPRLFYALDGTVSLVRSRFLHLYVDLQQREGIYDPAPQQPVLLPRGMRTPPAATPAPDPEIATSDPVPTAFRVFDMTQSRQVKTGQVEYFDGPVLSVLAYITAIEPEAEQN
jgi:hypothetical protein